MKIHQMTEGSVIEDLYIRNWPSHGISIAECDQLVVRNLYLDNSEGNAPNAISNGKEAAHNTDGFNIDTTTNLIISGCFVSNQDDCVAITSGDNIVVENMFCTGSE